MMDGMREIKEKDWEERKKEEWVRYVKEEKT